MGETVIENTMFGEEITTQELLQNAALGAFSFGTLDNVNRAGKRAGKELLEEGVEKAGRKANPNGVKVAQGHQDKHIRGTNNYNQEAAKGKQRSILSENPQQLLDDYAGTGQPLGGGTNKERVDCGKIIGQYYDETTGTYTDTTKCIIHYDSKDRAHIVPARP